MENAMTYMTCVEITWERDGPLNSTIILIIGQYVEMPLSGTVLITPNASLEKCLAMEICFLVYADKTSLGRRGSRALYRRTDTKI